MGTGTGIPWCDNTFSTHWGCVEVSPECDHCYAREFDARFGGGHWGKDAPRRFFKEDHWNQLLTWNKAAERGAVGKDGRRILVFVDSMSDLFESRDDLDAVREMFWSYARRVTSLRLLLLTKRPQNIDRMVPRDLIGAPHIWYGTTVGLPESLWRADTLLAQEAVEAAPVRFLSMEPLLAQVSVRGRFNSHPSDLLRPGGVGVNWVVLGSESGDGARPMVTRYAQEIIEECKRAGIAVFMKQADEGAEGIATSPPSGLAPERNAPYRRPDLRRGPDGIRRRHWVIERPYIFGAQSVEWPA